MRTALLLATTLVTISSVSALEINGWYPCGPTTRPRADDGVGKVQGYYFNVGDVVEFECAQVPMPLCHDGVCKGEAGEKIQVFVKRIVAAGSGGGSPVQNGKPPKSIWFVAGGPGSTSDGMEPRMYAAYKELNATVNVYTLDHRGTGRSNILQCEAAQVNTDGSPASVQISEDEMVSCLKDLNFRYKNKAAAFSITSAAMDLKKIIEGLQANEDVFVNGFSYGTSLLQRLVQLKPAPVRGFIFEGVGGITTEKDPIQSAWSRWDQNSLPSTRRLFEACADDASCPLKFQNKTGLVGELQWRVPVLVSLVGKGRTWGHEVADRVAGGLLASRVAAVLCGEASAFDKVFRIREQVDNDVIQQAERVGVVDLRELVD